MNEVWIIILKIAGLIIALAGIVLVYAAPKIVDKKNLAEKKQIDPERVAMLTEEEVTKFKRDSAILDLKIKGLLVALPGFVLILVMFKI